VLSDIETARLVLRHLSTDAIKAGLSGDRPALESVLGISVPADLFDRPGVLHRAQAELDRDAAYLPWSARAIVLKRRPQMIGHIRFHTPPDPDYLRELAPGGVEIGYEIFPNWRRQGYAREALGGVMDWATTAHGVRRFIATIAPDNAPSLGVVARFDFRRIGEHIDPEDGLEHIFLREVA
jgi:RimJ/RimL family protein N-acetyltransferase